MLQTLPGYLFTPLDVETRNLAYRNVLYVLLTAGKATVLNTGPVEGLFSMWTTQVTSDQVDACGLPRTMLKLSHHYMAGCGLFDRKELLHKKSMELWISVVVPQEVLAMVTAKLEARLPGEYVLIGLDNVRKRLPEDCLVVILQGANIPMYLVECGIVSSQQVAYPL